MFTSAVEFVPMTRQSEVGVGLGRGFETASVCVDNSQSFSKKRFEVEIKMSRSKNEKKC